MACSGAALLLLARSQYASGRSCDLPIRAQFSVFFLGHGANAELVLKFHDALHASHAALPILTSKFRPKVAPPVLTLQFHQFRPSKVNVKIQNSDRMQ
jgi:hypothetical protein